MPRNKVAAVHTIDRVARDLGVDVERIWQLADGLDTEDGVIWVHGLDDDGVMAFTDDGIEEVSNLLDEYGRDPETKA
ncbi:MAG: hypothetical protein FWD68_01630 [Alphaproteobacteria bacterium]|nr:hypothetical protein [Alphaproteobacteria bacterium]